MLTKFRYTRRRYFNRNKYHFEDTRQFEMLKFMQNGIKRQAFEGREPAGLNFQSTVGLFFSANCE